MYDQEQWSRIKQYWDVILAYLSDSSWLKALQNLFTGLDLLKERNRKGLYEVINYEVTLELIDKKGKKASVSKHEVVKYLRDNNVAFQDQAWGDGKILLYYRCSPGIPVDTYRSGFKTYILISLRQVKNRGDIDEFHINWGIHDGFLKPTGFWATEVNHPTDKIKMRVIFPKTRPPLSASILEKNRQRSTSLGRGYFLALPDGNSEITWECNNPTLFEHYILKWEW